MTDNNIAFNNYEFRTKRTAKRNKRQFNPKIMLTYDINKDKKEKNLLIYNNENMNQNYSENNNNKSRFTNVFNDFLDVNINLNESSSNNDSKNKYPDFQSSLQLTPKDNVEIPSIKYYNYIFNIGTPTI